MIPGLIFVDGDDDRLFFVDRVRIAHRCICLGVKPELRREKNGCMARHFIWIESPWSVREAAPRWKRSDRNFNATPQRERWFGGTTSLKLEEETENDDDIIIDGE